MAITVKHNMTALNAERRLGITVQAQKKSTEKLSSGYRINRAADDAAGLAMSEKMRRQIRGLKKGAENIQDGISLCQIADGALNETVEILQRMRELAVKSANGTYSETDRFYIDMEVEQLKLEIDRIANTTSFNDSVYPLNGEEAVIDPGGSIPDTPDIPVIPGGPGGSTQDITLKQMTVTFTANTSFTYEGVRYKSGDNVTITGMTTNGREIRFDGGYAYNDFGPYRFQSQSPTNTCFGVRTSDLHTDANGSLYFVSKSTGDDWYYAYKKNDGSVDPIASDTAFGIRSLIAGGYKYFTTADLDNAPTTPDPGPDPGPVKPETPAQTRAKPIYIKAGADCSSADSIPIYLVCATCKGLNISDLSVTTVESSSDALDTLNEALSKASGFRSYFGATQNRLENAYNINQNIIENTQYAESRIRDTDIATETVRYSNASILAQTGYSMLAQANQSNQSTLSLLT